VHRFVKLYQVNCFNAVYVEQLVGLCSSAEGGADSADVLKCLVTVSGNMELMKLKGLKFDVGRSVRHHTIQIN
jgi:hypothetical protein